MHWRTTWRFWLSVIFCGAVRHAYHNLPRHPGANPSFSLLCAWKRRWSESVSTIAPRPPKISSPPRTECPPHAMDRDWNHPTGDPRLPYHPQSKVKNEKRRPRMRNIGIPSKAALEGRESRSLPSYHQRKLQIWPRTSDALHPNYHILKFTSYEEMVRIW